MSQKCGLGRMYAGGGELTENIDDVGGVGTAEFASKAIDIFYMSRRKIPVVRPAKGV